MFTKGGITVLFQLWWSVFSLARVANFLRISSPVQVHDTDSLMNQGMTYFTQYRRMMNLLDLQR